jgi:hypothetical protein
MKRTPAFLILFFGLVLPCSYCNAQGKDAGLVAAPYPGSVAEKVPSGGNPFSLVPVNTRLRRFYTKDESEKVEAYYAKTLGPFSEYHSVSVVPQKEIYDILAKHGINTGEAGGDEVGGVGAGVTVIGRTQNSSYPVTKTLERLTGAYLARFMNEEELNTAKHMEDPLLKQTLARYEPLQSAHYMTTDVKQGDPPRNLTMDAVLYDKYFDAPERALAKEQEELVKKMTEATTKMKYDEAAKIGDRIMKISQRQTDKSWEWDVAIKCLDEMKANAYATIVVIDMHPSQWDLSGVSKKK